MYCVIQLPKFAIWEYLSQLETAYAQFTLFDYLFVIAFLQENWNHIWFSLMNVSELCKQFENVQYTHYVSWLWKVKAL